MERHLDFRHHLYDLHPSHLQVVLKNNPTVGFSFIYIVRQAFQQGILSDAFLGMLLFLDSHNKQIIP